MISIELAVIELILVYFYEIISFGARANLLLQTFVIIKSSLIVKL